MENSDIVLLLFALVGAGLYISSGRKKLDSVGVGESKAVGVIASDSSLPRGVRNNNPGNIKHSVKNPWRGLVGFDGVFCVFDSPENGIRAMARVLMSYRARGIFTLEGIIYEWSPPDLGGDNNPTESYLDFVARKTGIAVKSSVYESDYPAVIAAIIAFENGHYAYSEDVVRAGVMAA